MKKRYIMVFDIDGTLAPYRRPLKRDVADGLCTLEKRGHTVCLASGKPCPYIEGLMRGIGLENALAIGENGAVVSTEYSSRILYAAARPDVFNTIEAQIADRFKNVYFQENAVNITAFFDDDKTAESIDCYLERYRGRDDMTVYMHKDAVDIVPSGVNKGASLSMLAQKNGWAKTSIIASGDGDNDVSMAGTAGRFFAVGDQIDGHQRFDDAGSMMRYLLETYQ